ncbi:MAG: TetR/AcrR family transcriptional regulator [Clostridiales bacterium]|nr:TetR/AcrR family transcriptional regulator [Clostridiales bacterium]
MAKLRDAAYELFTSIGVHNTRIDDIVKNAGVAKGTFYLYCKDKYDLVDKVILRKSTDVINNAMKAVADKQQKQEMNFLDNVIVFVDHLVEYFKSDKKLLALIYKNLSWDLYEKALTYEEMDGAKQTFIQKFITNGGDSEIARQRLFIIVSMVGAVCYNSIVLGIPYPIDRIKPELYRSITRIIAS